MSPCLLTCDVPASARCQKLIHHWQVVVAKVAHLKAVSGCCLLRRAGRKAHSTQTLTLNFIFSGNLQLLSYYHHTPATIEIYLSRTAPSCYAKQAANTPSAADMPRRSPRLAPAPVESGTTAPQHNANAPVVVNAAPMNIPLAPRPVPPPIKPGAVTFLDLAGEIRNQIYGELLPDKSIPSAERSKKLRLDGEQTSTAFMATCHQVYEEAVSLLYPPTISDTLTLKVSSAGTVTFLGRMNRLFTTKPANFAIITRAKRLYLQIEVGRSLQSAAVCNVQDAMFNVVSLLRDGHQLQSVRVNISIGADQSPFIWGEDWAYDDWDFDDIYGFGWRGGRGMLGRMQEFRVIKPGDISRAHIAAFLTDPLRMIRRVKNGPKYSTFSLDFPGKTGKPWRELHGQVYDLIRGTTPVPNFAAFTRYFDALRQMKRVFVCFGDKSKGKTDSGRESFEKHVEELSHARIRGDINKFRETHLSLLPIIDSSIALRIDFSKTRSYLMAETKEHWCRELTYLKMELEAALPSEDLDVSFRGYNIADAGLHEWQTVGRKEAREAKRKRKADKEARMEGAKKAKIAEKDGSAGEESDEGSE